jgi:hypothetical protein
VNIVKSEKDAVSAGINVETLCTRNESLAARIVHTLLASLGFPKEQSTCRGRAKGVGVSHATRRDDLHLAESHSGTGLSKAENVGSFRLARLTRIAAFSSADVVRHRRFVMHVQPTRSAHVTS